MKLNRLSLVLASFAALTTLACGSDDDSGSAAGRGSIALKASGEAAAVDGFPVEDEGETIAFEDDWTVQFSKVYAAFGDVSVKDAAGATAYASTDSYVVNLQTSEVVDVKMIGDLGAQRWDAFGYAIQGPVAGSINVGSVPQADVDAMVAGKFNYRIAGTATKGNRSVRFEFDLANATTNTACTNGEDETAGVVVPVNSEVDAVVTFHLDHVFWSTLGSEENPLRFEAIAGADFLGNKDGTVTFDELALQQLASLKDGEGNALAEGGTPIVYNPGSVALPQQNLQQFMLKSAQSMGHLNGGGLCTVGAK
jgi:hypothetical protein